MEISLSTLFNLMQINRNNWYFAIRIKSKMIYYSEILLYQISLTSFISWHNMSMLQNLILSFLLSSKWNHCKEILIWLNKCTQFWGQFNKWKIIVTSMRYLDFQLRVIWCNLLHFVPEKCVFNIYLNELGKSEIIVKLLLVWFFTAGYRPTTSFDASIPH